jgi:hypothetical protein
MEKISITRALSELKLIDKKIESLILKNFVGIYQKKENKIINTGMYINDFEKEADENFQSLQDLLNRKEKIKMAICRKNSITKVKINNIEMTIVEVIGYKTSILPVLKKILDIFNKKMSSLVRDIENNRLIIEENINKMLQQNLGKDRKADKDQYDSIAMPFIEQNQLNLSDKANIKNYLKELEEKINNFENNIDFCLSEINSKTEIEL